MNFDLNFDELFPSNPLHEAASRGDLETVSTLLAEGMDVNATASQEFTPLHEAISRLHENFQRMLQGIREERQNTESPANLFETIQKFDMKTMAKQMFHRPDVVPISEPENLDVVRLLIEHGANVNAVSETGATPLHFAAGGGQLETVKFLLDAGANIHFANNDGKTALSSAIESQRVEAVRLLLERGTNPRHRSKTGGTLLIDAAMTNNVQIAEMLLTRGVEINTTTTTGSSPLLSSPA